jgi:hypothetical protein
MNQRFILWAVTALFWLGIGHAVAGIPEPVFDAHSSNITPVWTQGITELSGAIATDDNVASGLLAGEAADLDASLTLRVAGTYSLSTGLIFGYRDPQNLWLAGYSPNEKNFAILRQSAGGLEVMASVDAEIETGAQLVFTVQIKGRHIVISRDGKELVSFDSDQEVRGQVGIGSVYIRGCDTIIEGVRIRLPDGKLPYELQPQGAPGWTPFHAPGLIEGRGEWENVQLLLSPAETKEEEGPRAALLLDEDSPGTRYQREVKVRNDIALRGLGITGLVFGYRDATHYSLLGLEPEKSRVELWHRSPAGFEPLASATFEMEDEWLDFGIKVGGDRVQVQTGGRILFDLRDPRFVGTRTGLASYGTQKRSGLWRTNLLYIGGEPLPLKEPDDLLALALGTRPLLLEPADLPRWEALIDHPLTLGKEKTKNAALDKGISGETFSVEGTDGPLAVVFAFPYQRLARIEQVRVRLNGKGDVGPVRFLSSIDTPITGFTELAVLTPAAGTEARMDIDPVTAKYLRVELPEAAGRTGQIAEIYAGGSLQGRAVALRTHKPAEAETGAMEREPNDTPGQAMRLAPAVWIGGSTGFGDIDHYRLNLPEAGGRVVLTGRNTGSMSALYTLLGQDGSIKEPTTTERSDTEWQAAYDLTGGPWYLRISSDPLSLSVLFDDSGSMGEAKDALPKLLLSLADRVGPGLRVKLMKYAGTPVEIFNFIDDPKVLREAVEREVAATGGTETLAGLHGGLTSLRNISGYRALLVALDGMDGENSPELYRSFWQALVEAGVPVYIIGIGEDDWDSEYRALGLSDRNFFSEAAWISHGRFLMNPSLEAFKKGVTDILADLSTAVPYQVKAEFIEADLPPEPQGQGSLQVMLAPDSAKERVRTVELILDASNSMWGRIEDKSKIEIAREVLRGVVEGLPDGVHLGLRVYGHRWPRTDSRACTDSELVFPIGAPDKKALIRHVQGITPKGRTPLVYSLLQTTHDFQGLPRGTVILVSDGIESCDGQIDDVVKALSASGLDLTVHIVGFDVREKNSRNELERTARAFGGQYYDAGSARELSQSLERSLRIEHEVLAADDTVVARGFANGDAITLDAGEYRLRILLEPEPILTPIRIQAKGQQTFTVSHENGSWKISGQ